jgi:hypothetical protein
MPDYGHDIEFGYFLTPDALRTVIEEVAPQVRERLATVRAVARE